MSDDQRDLPQSTPVSGRSEPPATIPVVGACPEGVPPEDVAAWALDGAEYARVDLGSHVAACPACGRVAASLERASAMGRTLRDAGDSGPPTHVIDQALGRIRAERTATLLLGTVGGAFLRVAAAVGDLGAGREGADTAERPRLRPPSSDG